MRSTESVRKTFDQELEALKQTLLRMVDLAERALEDSMMALKEQNLLLAKVVIDSDAEINRLDEEINGWVIQLIAQQQPVATDLRKIITALKISTDVERVGDLAANIAKCTLHIGDEPLIKPIVDIPKMASIVQEMLRKSFDAYDLEDPRLALEIAETDDRVDRLYGERIRELMQIMTLTPRRVNQITQLAFICRNLERVGDHAVNMAESILYLTKGEQYHLN
ncbi:phosphate signaling complex protein PhoU [Edaphobacillus lindanitolerans]|uniref:Phosphate-specific transport system accessory protein PhoU n=1 Tax=Edaphobacillus lindanitolerans TaxID=550447 RepID=A0A1U7PR75_9BACI|nr:phosphate signaling complex protein PhoU [Edaphobacillus lindanitolerans]SIT87128.1 phosphate transport system protein [Edaphobacillus lindanitolerans]